MTRDLYLIKGDLKIIGRDPMLILSFVAPFLLLIIALFLFPIVSQLSIKYFSLPLDSYFLLGSFFFFSLIPMLFGMIYGFILLDERDEAIISYLSITPLGKSGYLRTRMIIPVLASFVFGMAFLILTGFSSLLNWFEIIVITLIVATEAPLMLLFLAAFAGNKVEGIALTKSFGIILLPVVIDYFTQGSWRWVLSFSPLWWIERAIFSLQEYRWLYLAGATVFHGFFIWLLFSRFERKMQ